MVMPLYGKAVESRGRRGVVSVNRRINSARNKT